MSDLPEQEFTTGPRLARGICRYLVDAGFAPLTEFAPTRGLRADVIAIGPKGDIWIIECKSSRADFAADRKWHKYLAWCDRFFWAVSPTFPTSVLPPDAGLLLGDDFGAEMVRMGAEERLAPARRKALLHSFARQAAFRLVRERDSGFGYAAK